MSDLHGQFLELAAAAIDFRLSAAERVSLDQHLEGCVRCRRVAVGLSADQRALTRLPRYAPSSVVSEQIWARIRPSRRSAMPMLRLILVAAMLALLAMSAVAVGAEILRRDRSDLSVVPSPTTDPSIAPAPPTAPAATPDITSEPSVPPTTAGFPAGSIVEVVTVGLRVRTEPTVDDAISVKLDPLLGPGTKLRVVDGPVTADDYDWYLVEAVSLAHRGWVAAADHDGEAWIDVARAAASAAPMSALEGGLRDALRADVASDCTPRRTELPVGALAGIECRIESDAAAIVGAYRLPDAREAALAYLDRLAGYGVTPGTGDCAANSDGDAAWTIGGGDTGSGETVEVEGVGTLAVGRVGCFLNENDIANVRVTCGSTYIGILGRDDDVGALHRWVWGSDGPHPAGARPAICRTDR